MRSCTLRGKARVATHWASCAALAEFPEVSVDAESLFVANGNLWTSAGISTGINMALAMVERDIGGVMADRIAKFMVLYSRRPGFYRFRQRPAETSAISLSGCKTILRTGSMCPRWRTDRTVRETSVCPPKSGQASKR